MGHLQTLLTEFVFASPADRVTALSAMLTAAVRDHLNVAPAFNITASSPGSGKSYLSSVIAPFAGPGEPRAMSYPMTNEEATKVVLAIAIEQPAVVCFDDMPTDWLAHGALTLLALAARYMDYVETYKRAPDIDERYLRLHLLPKFGKRRINDLDQTEIMEWLSEKVRRKEYAQSTVNRWQVTAYAGSSARTMSGRQAAAAFWNDDAAQKLPYQRGALLAAMWNARLLTASRGAANLDEILHAQIAAARSSKAGATTLFRSLAARQGLDISADEDRYLAKGEMILLPAHAFGPCATIVTEQRPSFSRGFDAEATASAGNAAKGVDPALPAYVAGLRDGMKILARIEGEPDNAVVPYALLVEDGGKQRTIRYLPQGRDRVTVQQLRLISPVGSTCPATLGGLPPA